jgi:hypothetical protein
MLSEAELSDWCQRLGISERAKAVRGVKVHYLSLNTNPPSTSG